MPLMNDQVFKRLRNGHARLANSNDRLLWPRHEPSHQARGQRPNPPGTHRLGRLI